jgi:hypothetical protein
LDERLSSETLACNEDPHPRRGFGHAHRMPDIALLAKEPWLLPSTASSQALAR